jgi:hypothetical protein
MFTSWLDLRSYADREWIVLADLEWRSEHAHVVVPRGFVTDLASIPRPLRGLLDVNGPSREPAVLHDWLYCHQQDAAGNPVTRAWADELFRLALARAGVSLATRTLYWSGVRLGGWRYWGRRGQTPLNREDFAPTQYLEAVRVA